MAPKTLTVDFISDVVCPWCLVGLSGLEQAIAALDGEVEVRLRFQPFELNPAMPAEGQDIAEHVAEKYGASRERSAASRQAMRDAAAAVGAEIRLGEGARIYNTFDAHRLLHWAEETAGLAAQARLKHALFDAYFLRNEAVSESDVLLAAVAAAGLDPESAAAVLASDRYVREVRGAEAYWREEGVHAVPTAIVEDRFVITGSQPPAAYERALRHIAGEAASA